MVTPDDPYKPPAASLESARGHEWDSQAVPDEVVALLAKTRPWVKLIAALIFVGFGLVLVIAVVMGLAGLGSTKSAASALAFLPLLFAALLYLLPALFLWRYAASIRQLQDGGGQAALETALRHQKSFWKFAGVLAVVMTVVYAIALILGGLSGALSG